MNCTEINTHIDDYLEGVLAGEDLHAFEQHVANCVACSSKLERIRAVGSTLKDLYIAEPSVNFEQRMFSEVRRQYKDNRRHHFATGFTTAIAASLAIWFTSSVILTEDMLEDTQVVSMAINEVKTVRLLFDSQTDIADVSLSIGLPENMQLDGYPGQRKLTWNTSLKKGENVLALPLMAIDPGQGELVATLNFSGKVKVLRVVLKSSANGVLYYQMDSSNLG